MKERPILFSGAMVRAILEGRKTMTRRVVKPQPTPKCQELVRHGDEWLEAWEDEDCCGAMVAHADYPQYRHVCRYGKSGDRLWVRETHKGWFTYEGEQFVSYQADGSVLRFERPQGHPEGGMLNGKCCADKWRPSIHMPRWASRITLEVTAVRVERLQEITDADALAEGACLPDACAKDGCYRAAFEGLWASINGVESWDANPWVWVVEFRRVEE